MIRRFRMIAGPNGSGKSTLVRHLHEGYAVNFYHFLNADDILAMVKRDGVYMPSYPVEVNELAEFAAASTYSVDVKELFQSGAIGVDGDCVRFAPEAVNSYTVALFTNFLQDAAIRRGVSFSQETVFSHPSKIDALRKAQEAGYRTYLYYIATDSPEVNMGRVACRRSQGGHDVPIEKTKARYARSLGQVRMALPYLSRGYFFDNSGSEMLYIGQYEEGVGFRLSIEEVCVPGWFRRLGIR